MNSKKLLLILTLTLSAISCNNGLSKISYEDEINTLIGEKSPIFLEMKNLSNLPNISGFIYKKDGVIFESNSEEAHYFVPYTKIKFIYTKTYEGNKGSLFLVIELID